MLTERQIRSLVQQARKKEREMPDGSPTQQAYIDFADTLEVVLCEGDDLFLSDMELTLTEA